MGNYLSKVTPYRPVFGKQETLNESNIIVGEEIEETNQNDLIEEHVALTNGQTNGTTLKEHLNDEQVNDETDDEIVEQTNGNTTNGNHANGHTENGHTENGSSDNLNGQSNGANHNELNESVDDVNEDLNEEEQLNGKLNKSDLKIKKDDKQYSNKKINLINEDEQEVDDEFETVGRKRKGKRGATKKQYKKRKNNLLNDLQRVNDIAMNE